MSQQLRLALAALLLVACAQVIWPSPGTAVPAPSGDLETVVVTLRGRVNPATISGSTRAVRLSRLVRALQSRADTDQVSLRRWLRTRVAEGLVTQVTPLWIVNAVSVTATSDVIAELATRRDVLRVESDVARLAPAAAPAEPNVEAVQAPAVWGLGDSGQGVVVATLDSGVDVSHPDLAGRWRGGTNSWFDPYGEHPTTPTDLTGHGTGTMGVILGGDDGGSSIGVAPGASWIAAKIFNDHGSATDTAVHQAFQWVLDPDHDPSTADAPQVVNGSWSLGTGPGCDLTYQPDVQALRAAGILPVFAAGNFGPGDSSSVSPANYPESLSVGAVNDTGTIWSASSRGASDCGGRTRPFPDLVAPGVGVRTADRFGFYQTLSGTSIAAPHAAGALALLLGGAPALTPDQQWDALTGSAVDLGVPGPDDVYGHGRLDVLAARTSLQDAPDTAGPTVSSMAVNPEVAAAGLPISVGAQASDVLSGGSDVSAGEYFVDALGADGTGTPIEVAAPAAAVSMSAELPSTLLATLADGPHTVWLHARDATGNWGPAVNSGFVLDTLAPALSSAAVAPATTQGATLVSLSAEALEAGSGLAGAEWFAGNDPGAGNGTPMTISGPGPYTLSAAVDVSGWPLGSATLALRARDAAGNWSIAVPVTVTVTAAAPQAQLWFSTLGNAKPPGVPGAADDADVYRWTGSAFARDWDASAAWLPGVANVDGYDRVDATHFYLSFAAASTAVPGLGNVGDEDVVYFDNGIWSLWFDGSAHGLSPAGLDLDAISVSGTVLFFSTVGNTKVPGVVGAADDADLYSWSGTGFARIWDASAFGVPGAANVDGYVRVDANRFYLSFSPTSTMVPGLGTVQDEDVIQRSGGTWSTYFDGTARGLTSDALDLDAFDVG